MSEEQASKSGSEDARIREEIDERAYVALITPYVCSLCDYPVLATWKFCPHCGGMLDWITTATAGGVK